MNPSFSPSERPSSSHDVVGERADVVVVGAGPGGLAAAIEARRAGAARVVVLDKRPGHSRRRAILLEWEVIVLLQEWGIDPRSFNRARSFTFSHGYGRREHSVRLPLPLELWQPRHRGVRDPRPWDIVLRRFPAATEEIRVIESALLDAARAAGVDVCFRADVDDAPEPNGRLVTARYRLEGEPRALVADYLVVADGCRSPVNQHLGNTRLPYTAPSYVYAGAVFRDPAKDLYFRWVPRDPFALAEIVAVGNGEHVTLYYRLADGERADARALSILTRRAASSIGIEGPMVEGPFTYDTAMDRLCAVDGDPRIVCVGDANRKGDPGFGGNLNEAIRDGRRFGNYYRRARANPMDAEAAWRHFLRQTESTTAAIHLGGAMANVLRVMGSAGAIAQSYLPAPLRAWIHLDVNLLLRASGSLTRSLARTTQRALERHRARPGGE